MSGPAVEENDLDVTSPTGAPPTTPYNITYEDRGVETLAVRASFLALFIIIGFVGNSVLVATIAQSSRLKKTVLNLFIISICTVNLVDCIVNMPMILGSTVTDEWDYGRHACWVNAFGVQLASMCMILGMLLMTIDRLLAIRNISNATKRLTVAQANGLIVFCWLFSIAISMPILVGVVRVEPNPQRYICGIIKGVSIIYISFVSFLGYLLPVLIILCFFVYIIKVSVGEKLRESRISSRREYTDNMIDEPRIWSEINASKYVGVLILFWCICEGPFLLLTSVELYRNSDYLNTTNSTITFDYPWQVDLTITWLRLSYPIFLPIITFFWRKEVWQKFKNCLLCRKANLIVDASPRKSPQRRAQNKGKPQNVDASKSDVNFSVPVLFASKDGLYFETFDNKDSNEDLSCKSEVTRETDTKINKCDVNGSVPDLLQGDGDTSDYDSQMELDPFSVSNPISVKSRSSRNSHGSIDRSYRSRTGSDGSKPSGRSRTESDANGSCRGSIQVTIETTNEEESSHQTSETGSMSSSQRGTHERKKNKRRTLPVLHQDDEKGSLPPITKNEPVSVKPTAQQDAEIIKVIEQDSGRDSTGENSIKKKTRKKRSTVTDSLPESNVSEIEMLETQKTKGNVIYNSVENDKDVQVETPMTISEEYEKEFRRERRRKKKKKKDVKIENENEPDTTTLVQEINPSKKETSSQTYIHETHSESSFINERKLPKLKVVQHKTDSDTQNAFIPVDKHPVERGHTRHKSDYVRTQSVNDALLKDSPKQKLTHKRSLSESHDNQGPVPPKPTPRKTKSKTNVSEESTPKPRPRQASGDSDLIPPSTPIPMPRSRSVNELDDNDSLPRKEDHKSVFRLKPGESQQPLLDESGTSTDLSELSNLNKAIVKEIIHSPKSIIQTTEKRRKRKASDDKRKEQERKSES